jgi:hypothetical protein
MYYRRSSDRNTYHEFRISRFIKEGGKWYFFTREATMEGPFESRFDAEQRLASYIKRMDSGFMPRENKLSIESLDSPRQ